MTKALIVYSDGNIEEYNYEKGYKELQYIVDGYIEAVSFGNKPYFCYCNDEGKMVKLEQNKIATDLWYDSGQIILIGDYIAGNVVFFGEVDDEGNNTDYPQELLDDLKKYTSK
jgi:hypothetical protein